MRKNPYKFTGLLDPVENQSVCVTRENDLKEVISGILQGDYWTVIGPRQIGKTTFLRQVKHELAPSYPCIYVNLETSPKSEEGLYNWIKEMMLEEFGENPLTDTAAGSKDFGAELNFYSFLKKFRPGKDKKIVFLFDEIEKVHSIRSFLTLWRKVFTDRFDRKELKKYAVVIAGAAELIPMTIGPTSPFNIARSLYLDNLTKEESEKLIDVPFKEIGIEIEAAAEIKLLNETSGHPQLLQHACHILVKKALEEGKKIVINDVNEAIERLFIKNANLKTLAQQIKSDKALSDLLKRILDGEKIRYAPYQGMSLTGVGPIVNRNSHCAIRSKIHERFLR